MTVEYSRGKPVAVRDVVIAAQHHDEVANERLRDDIIEMVIKPVIPKELREIDPKIHVNPTGRFVIGGPMGDAGLTGRKIIVDSYGGMARHGGGCFSGKDPSKVDRSGAYAARWVAKNVVAAGLADRFEFEIATAIGIAQPISISIETSARHAPGRADPRPDQAALRPAPGGDHRSAEPAPADLPADGGLRPLRPAGPRPALGAHRQGGGARRRGWPTAARAGGCISLTFRGVDSRGRGHQNSFEASLTRLSVCPGL